MDRCVKRSRHVAVLVKICLIVVGVSALVYLYGHDPSVNGGYPRCLFHSLTGLWCPGCGVTRGLYAFLHGEYLETVRMNPYIFCIMPMLAFAAYVARRPAELRSIGFIAVLSGLLFWVLRNVGIWQFVLLSPS